MRCRRCPSASTWKISGNCSRASVPWRTNSTAMGRMRTTNCPTQPRCHPPPSHRPRMNRQRRPQETETGTGMPNGGARRRRAQNGGAGARALRGKLEALLMIAGTRGRARVRWTRTAIATETETTATTATEIGILTGETDIGTDDLASAGAGRWPSAPAASCLAPFLLVSGLTGGLGMCS